MSRMNDKASARRNALAVVENGTISTLRNEVLSNGENVLSSNVLNRFCAYLDVSALSVRSYISGIRQFIAYLNIQNVVKPTRENVVMFKKALIAHGAKPSTVAAYLSAIRRFFGWCASEGIYENITAGVKSPRQDKSHKRDALQASQIRDCLNGFNRETLEGKRNYAIFLLMATAGLRTCEVTRADIQDVQQVQGVSVLFVFGKNRAGKSEFVKLSQPVYQAICEYLRMRGQVQDDEPLFASCSRRNRGQRLTTRTISGIAKRAMVQAGYSSRRLTAHSLRHSAATLALDAGMALQEVSEFMRHSSISITMIYIHSLNRLKSQCENAVTAAIFAA